MMKREDGGGEHVLKVSGVRKFPVGDIQYHIMSKLRCC